jgi:hypothetical protein
MMLAKGAFSQSTAYNDSVMEDWSYMRETAYALLMHIHAADFGLTRNMNRIEQLKFYAFSQLDQSFVRFTAEYRKPFMVGLSAQALIEYYEQINPDPQVIERLKIAADYMWGHMWSATGQGFKYTDQAVGDQGQAISPDLNMLIAPMYAWLYKMTGDAKYIQEGDQIWKGGVDRGYLAQGKQFNQNYRLSFRYLKYRNG